MDVAKVKPEIMSDNSVAYNVVCTVDKSPTVLHFECEDKRSAETLCRALNKTTNIEVKE